MQLKLCSIYTVHNTYTVHLNVDIWVVTIEPKFIKEVKLLVI